jgi:hypothetical protein
MKKILAVFLMLLCMTACSDQTTAVRLLEEQGYKNISITGYVFFGCSEDDTFHTGFVATSAAGKQVEGVVCSDWFKGATIRLF